MTREMPKIKRIRKLVITEKQAVGCSEGEDIIRQDEDVDSKLSKQIEISKQRMMMKYKKNEMVDDKEKPSTPLKSLENAMLENKLQRRIRRIPHSKELLEPSQRQSTPINNRQDKQNDPFGFDVLDSPLVFSPVLPSNNSSTASSSSHLQASSDVTGDVMMKRRSFGTYDIPVKSRPVMMVKKRKQKNNQPISTMEEWAKQLNAEFDDVDNYQLTIDDN